MLTPTSSRSPHRTDCCYSGVDWVQENVLGQGPQDNESAFEQAKDEQISDCKFELYRWTLWMSTPVLIHHLL